MKRDSKQKIILGIILIVVIILCALYAQLSNSKDKEINNIYSSINIDTSKLNMFFFNVGQADSSLILYKDKVILIDAGNDSDGEKIVEFLKAKGINKIDYLIGTHIHEDHIGGMADIVDNISVEKIYMPYNVNEDANFYKKVTNSINSKELSVEIVSENDKVLLSSNFILEVLYVDNKEPLNPNNASIVLQLEYGAQKYLFMGDAEKEVETKLLQEDTLEDIDVLKVGHHGSETSSTKEFIDKVLPEISIISVQNGRYNNMPSQNIIDRLENNGDQVYITDTDGTIWIISDGITNDVIILKDLNLNGASKLGLRVYFKYALFSV